ncbi:MAG TPA: TRAP transporter substrate-binding protein [Alphaproteobacteria bacterium]
MKHAILAIAAAAVFAAPGAEAADPIQLKFGFPAPPTSWVNTKGATPFAKAVEKDSGGLVEIKIFGGGQIGNFSNIYDRTLSGIADMSFGTTGSIAGTFAKSNVTSVPFEADRSLETSIAYWRLYEKGVIADEYEKVKPLALFTFSSSGMHTTKPIKSADDMKGLKLGATSKMTADALVLLGATPVTVTPAETYQAISRGLVTGANMSWPGVQVFKLFEVAKYHLDLPFGLGPAFFFMNKESYAKLPEKAQKAIDAHSGIGLTKQLGTAADQEEQTIRERVKTMPEQMLAVLTAEEKARWKRTLAPVTEAWVKATPDGARVLAAFRAELERARAGM